MKRSFKLSTKRFAGARECCKPTSPARQGSVGPGCRPLCVQQSSSTKKVVGDDGEGGGSEGEGARGEGSGSRGEGGGGEVVGEQGEGGEGEGGGGEGGGGELQGGDGAGGGGGR